MDADTDAYMPEDDSHIRRTKGGGLMLPGDVDNDDTSLRPLPAVDVVDVLPPPPLPALAALAGLRPPAGIGGSSVLLPDPGGAAAVTVIPTAGEQAGVTQGGALGGTLTRAGKRRVTFSSEPPDVSIVPVIPDVALEMDEMCIKL